MGKTVALISALPPSSNRVEIPDSMSPEEQALFMRELAKIGTSVATVIARDEERCKALDQRFRAIDARLARLELGAEASGQHNLAKLQSELSRRDKTIETWRGRVWACVATLITSAIVGLVVHYLSTR